jgi:uncharacterized membrane protein (UPF0182 family)
MTIAVIVACLVALRMAAGLLVDLAWFDSVGYRFVFLTVLKTKALLFLAVLVISAATFWFSGVLALRFARPPSPWHGAGAQTLPKILGRAATLLPRHALVRTVAVVLGILVAWGEVSNWTTVQRFIHQAPYGLSEPVFSRDIGFYLFSLPAYLALKDLLWVMLALSALVAGAVYWAHGDVAPDRGRHWLSPAATAHASVLLGVFFAIKAWSYSLDRYLLLYGDNGVVVGASYADLHVELPMLWVLMGLASAAAIASWANVRARTWQLPAALAIIVFGGSLMLGTIVPASFERFFVKPSELQLETPYIQRNIAMTREAYNLGHITVKPFPAEQGLTVQSLEENRATVDNIRLWDWQPLMDTYAQLQEIRTYYKFHDVDVDRYEFDGKYQQVMLSARELEPRLLPENAQTWVNEHLLFTHGTGVVMSPVTQKSAEGLPLFYLKDIPPVATGGPQIFDPRLYFGQGEGSYVIVKTSTPEFDYPKGNDNVFASYQGDAGVAIGGMARRALFAWYFDDPNIVLTHYITSESRILFRRNVQERVRTLAPFLRLDHDPYVVVSDGRLFWIQDAYTTSRWFPYAQPLPNSGSNYIRNAVKVVIDAHDGGVSFYVPDSGESLIATYGRIFPGLFKPLAAMPPDLQKHIRYPEDLFLIQAEIYRAYHMVAPEVFYNREDLWQFPRVPVGIDGERGHEGDKMVPYYIIMRLPGEARAEFFLLLPMVPSHRENMIAWLAARCDAPDYGKLIVYEFPKDKLVFGPFQIEARINQNTEISQQISLWNQMGSRVIRGNLLVVPIENSLLYVSPLYLRAETGQLPELKRVIAAYGDRVVMDDTLGGALASLFKGTAPASAFSGMSAGALTAGPRDERAREARDHYQRALDRLKAGDWTGFGAELESLGQLLEALSRGQRGH